VITTQGETIGVGQIRPGVTVTDRYRFVDSRGAKVAVMETSGILRRLRTDGPDRVGAEIPALPHRAEADGGRSGGGMARGDPDPAGGGAHLHGVRGDLESDSHGAGYARAAGPPDPILHGSATFVFSVRELMRRYLDNNPERRRRVAG